MNDPQLSLERARYMAIRERLLADDPEIDERTLRDTVEGATNFTDCLAGIVRAAIRDEAEVIALKAIIADMTTRAKRFEDRAAMRREIVRDEMEHVGFTKLTMPDFTASLRVGTPSVVVTDESVIPPEFFEMRPHLKKGELGAAMKAGIAVRGALLSNPRLGLTIRTK